MKQQWNKLTIYHKVLVTTIFLKGGYLELSKRKNGVWVHKIVYPSGNKEIIRSDTSKAIQRFLAFIQTVIKSKVQIKK